MKNKDMNTGNVVHFGSSIRSLRMELGLTQVQFAQKLSVNQVQVSKWELSPHPNARSLTKIADAFGLRIIFAFEKAGNKPN